MLSTKRRTLAATVIAVLLAFTIGLALTIGAHAQTTPAPTLTPAEQAVADAKAKAAEVAAAEVAAAAAVINSGDTAWMLASVALVLMMTIPGLALFYGGMVRKMNVLATVMQSFAITCLVTVLWVIYGYTLAFTCYGGTCTGDGVNPMNNWIGGVSRLMMNVGLNTVNADLAPTIPETVYSCFQLTFGIITCALIVGSVADRMKFSALMLFIAGWFTFVYVPIAHWVWGNGWLASYGVLDFAGGTVVHINSGIAGLVGALVLGKRKGYAAHGGETFTPHNLVLTMIGASLLWVGWFGFNAGSATAANGRAGMAMLVTQLATATAALSWMSVEWMVKGKPSVLGIVSGAVVGLVAITPASGFVAPGGALVIGVVGGVLCFFACTSLKNRMGYDDSLDTFGVHCIGGMVGAILTGVFAVGAFSATSDSPGGSPGLMEGNAHQVIIQCVGVLTTLVWSGGISFILYKIVDVIVGLRVDVEIEREGLDLGLHGEAVH
jgi:ammonium transporter, Amt family